jgi:colanic acid/amylovoran biosynthesis glycosyltransferase
MHIAYLVSQYPAVSHSFIRREILALERQDIEIMRVALRGWDAELVGSEDLLERERTRYVQRGGAPVMLLALVRMLVTRPMRLAQAAILAWQMGRRADRPLPVHFVYLAEACRIEPWLRAAKIQHMHVHFANNSAEIAMLVHVLGGPQWSLTVHGRDLENAPFARLAAKVQDCLFVIAISSYGRSQLYRWVEHQHWDKIKVVHCGLEPDYAVRQNPVSSTERFVCVGRLSPEKGQLLLIDAAQRLAAQGAQFELVLVGDGELRSDIEALIARYHLQARVRITGWMSSEQVRNEILAARALVVPSFSEGIPVVIMEAMALRRPVISTFVGGIPELVLPNKHGWLVPAGDVEALVRAMKACLDTPLETCVHMGEAAYQRVLARHSVDTQSTKLVELFRSAVEANAKST